MIQKLYNKMSCQELTELATKVLEKEWNYYYNVNVSGNDSYKVHATITRLDEEDLNFTLDQVEKWKASVDDILCVDTVLYYLVNLGHLPPGDFLIDTSW